MTYLLTGATGLIGRRLVDVLLQSGHAVNYLAARRSRALDSRASFHRWDRGEAPDFGGMPRLDAVVHLAGEPIAQRWSERVKTRTRESRVTGTRQVVDALSKMRHKPSVLVSASAVGYYGDRGDEMLDEDSAPGSDFLAQLCVDWEREALRAAELGLRVVTVRIAPVLSREGGALPRMLKLFRWGLGGRLGSGRQWMPWIHREDLVRLLLFATENEGMQGAVNGCAPHQVTNREFTSELARTVHRPAIFTVPRFALRLAVGELGTFLLASQRVPPKRAQTAGFQFEYSRLPDALESLAGSAIERSDMLERVSK